MGALLSSWLCASLVSFCFTGGSPASARYEKLDARCLVSGDIGSREVGFTEEAANSSVEYSPLGIVSGEVAAEHAAQRLKNSSATSNSPWYNDYINCKLLVTCSVKKLPYYNV